MVHSPWQLLGGQEVRRISRSKSECHGIRFIALYMGSLFRRKTEVYKELGRKELMQEVRWKDQEVRLMGTQEPRYMVFRQVKVAKIQIRKFKVAMIRVKV